jgi:hypothetical protein
MVVVVQRHSLTQSTWTCNDAGTKSSVAKTFSAISIFLCISCNISHQKLFQINVVRLNGIYLLCCVSTHILYYEPLSENQWISIWDSWKVRVNINRHKSKQNSHDNFEYILSVPNLVEIRPVISDINNREGQTRLPHQWFSLRTS